MQKNAHAYLVLLSISSFVSISVQNEVTVEQLQNYFNELLEVGRWRVNHKARTMLPALYTLPASVPDKSSAALKSFTMELDEDIRHILDRNFIFRVKYKLFTPKNKHNAFNLELTFDSFQTAPFDPHLETKVLIHGYMEKLPKSSVYYNIKDKLLEVGRYNVIIVDWTHHSFHPFERTATDAMFIGIQIAKFLFSLQQYKQINTKSIHIIAHGLGCHVAGMVGKMIPEIGRITGLDATGFLYDDLPSLLKLTSTDAEFVDAIHTDGISSNSKGVGTLYNYGDIDFFPNGGSVQPGCGYGDMYINKDKGLTLLKEEVGIIMCNHERSLLLFLASIGDCSFVAVNCGSFADFISGKCPPRSSNIANMGFHAKPIGQEVEQNFYALFTSSTYPFCNS